MHAPQISLLDLKTSTAPYSKDYTLLFCTFEHTENTEV